MRPITVLAVAWLLIHALQGVESPPMTPQTPDFSHAGFAGGDSPIPDLPIVADVRAFGAIGDGEADDTAAFNRAVATAPLGAVLVPAGRYRITDRIRIERSGIALRGEGRERSVLWFPRTLTDVSPDWTTNTGGRPTSNYSWSGGFLVIGSAKRPADAPASSEISTGATRGGRSVVVAKTTGLAVGQDVAISLEDDPARTLTAYLYAGDTGPTTKLGAQKCRQLARITRIDGTRIDLDRPLRYDLRPEWRPRLSAFVPRVRGSGIEDLGLAFPATPYGGHFTELGANGIELRGESADCWVRRILITNAESGVYVQGDRCTVADVTLTGDRPAAAESYGGARCIGHHGISVGGSDNLITGFDFRVAYIHDFTVEGGRAAGNVIAGGKGVDLCFDHHKKAPHANLFTDIDCGAGKRVWSHGGGDDLGKPSGTWEVFWNLRGAKPIPPPPKDWGPPGTITAGLDRPVEPRDLHAAQLAARLKAAAKP